MGQANIYIKQSLTIPQTTSFVSTKLVNLSLTGLATGQEAEDINTAVDTATNAVENNYLKHNELQQYIKDIRKCKNNKECINIINKGTLSLSEKNREQMRIDCAISRTPECLSHFPYLLNENSYIKTINNSKMKEDFKKDLSIAKPKVFLPEKDRSVVNWINMVSKMEGKGANLGFFRNRLGFDINDNNLVAAERFYEAYIGDFGPPYTSFPLVYFQNYRKHIKSTGGSGPSNHVTKWGMYGSIVNSDFLLINHIKRSFGIKTFSELFSSSEK